MWALSALSARRCMHAHQPPPARDTLQANTREATAAKIQQHTAPPLHAHPLALAHACSAKKAQHAETGGVLPQLNDTTPTKCTTQKRPTLSEVAVQDRTRTPTACPIQQEPIAPSLHVGLRKNSPQPDSVHACFPASLLSCYTLHPSRSFAAPELSRCSCGLCCVVYMTTWRYCQMRVGSHRNGSMRCFTQS